MNPGTRLGSYEITAKLGEGGMGEVFRARDTRLERDVAIKVLPPTLAADADALSRFEREAKAVAALSHPNILAIFDFGREGAIAYAAMELLDGETLRTRLAAGALPPRKALELAAQVAQGLAAAHDKGIVHRDLKPENLFLTRDGQVQILDFGLARQSEAGGSKSQLFAAPTQAGSALGTAPGTVLGTVGYMSPEQVRGELADSRSDIFSLGVVLYEMLTGKRGFARQSSVETMAAILRDEPPEIEALGERHSPALARLLQHCLEKRPEERFQSARDLAFDLRSLAGGGSAVERSGVAPSSALAPARRSSPGWALPLLLLAAGLVAGWLAGSRRPGPGGAAAGALQLSFRQLTKVPGGEGAPTLSPDGETFIYVKRDGGDQDLFAQRVEGSTAIALTADCAENDFDPAFSPDGRSVAFRSDCGGGGIFVMGATGESRRRVADFGYQPAWSPDGRRIAFWGLRGRSFQRDLWSVAADGSTPATESAVSLVDDPALDWSPVYSGDGRWLYFISTRGGTFNYWRFPVDAATGERRGEPEPVTAPSSWGGRFELSRDGRLLVFADRNIETEILRAALDPAGLRFTAPPASVFSGSFVLREQNQSPDGAWLLFTNEDLPQQIHLVRPDGSGYRQLTEGDRNRQADFSPDGAWIVFQTTRGEHSLAAIRPDGGGWQPLPVGPGFATPRWSPDGSTISGFDNNKNAMLVDVRGGLAGATVRELPPVAPGVLFWPVAWSADGALLAGRATRAGQIGDIVVRDMATGTYRELTGSAGAPEDFNLVFIGNRHVVSISGSGLWVRDVASGEAKMLYEAPAGRALASVAASRDGRWLSWIERADESDIWLMTLEDAAGRARPGGSAASP